MTKRKRLIRKLLCLTHAQHLWLRREAKQRATRQSEIVRRLIDREMSEAEAR